MTAPEIRAGAAFRIAGRTLTGTVLRYGDEAMVPLPHGRGMVRERFSPGAFSPVPQVPLVLEHDDALVIAKAGAYVLNDTQREMTIRAELRADSAALRLVKKGSLSGYSFRFWPKSERREGGVRIIDAARLGHVGLVGAPAYPSSRAELRTRSGRTLRQRIPAETELGCQCSGVQCKWAKFVGEAMSEMIDRAFTDATAEVLAVRGSYGTPLASKSAGTLRGRMDGDDAVFEVDLPDGPDGDAVLRDIENTGAVLARPYLDADASDGGFEQRAAGDDADERVMVYRRAVLRSLVIGATDATAGWPLPDLIRTPDELMPEGRAAPARRGWLLR